MANGNETVREVCADAKNTSTNWIRTMNVLGVMPTRECIHRWCDRILAAHERELAAKDAEVARLVTECNRLEAALKPVMELHLGNEDTCTYDELQDDMGCSLHAVREAQRIYKDGGAK